MGLLLGLLIRTRNQGVLVLSPALITRILSESVFHGADAMCKWIFVDTKLKTALIDLAE